ncbi:MAG TPA: hypothetical protein VNT58_05645 [Gaiellaceae bacterium]|nr:hypothetical protein [Gaiellaceae bacterium]
MRLRLVSVLLLVAVAAASAVAVAGATVPREAQTLVRLASGITKLRVKRPVAVVERPLDEVSRRRTVLDAALYPPSARAHDAIVLHALGVAATPAAAAAAVGARKPAAPFYDAATRRVVVPRTARPDRHALAQATAVALLDQHFAVRRASSLRGDRDRLAAARGATEGYAGLVAELVAPRRPPPAARGRLARFLQLEERFAATTGVRFAANLRNLGGDRGVWTSLRTFPASTEQLFHLDKFLERERPIPIVLPVDAGGMQLVSDDSWGELDVRALLATFGVGGIDRAASGWGGGRSAVYRGPGGETAVAIALDWDTEADAAQWREIAGRYVAAAFATPRVTQCAVAFCWVTSTRSAALEQVATRAVLVVAPSTEAAATIAADLVPPTR